MQIFLVLALLFSLLVAIFAIQNSSLVDINFLLWQFKNISLVLIILGSGAIGAIIMFFLGFSKQLKQKFRIKELQNKVNKLETDNENYKQKEAKQTEINQNLSENNIETAEEDTNIN